MKKAIISATLTLFALMYHVPGASAGEGGDAVKGQSVADNCSPCHGPQGNNTSGLTVPRLAQQVAPYIIKQLSDFKSGARSNSIMSTMAATLSDSGMRDVAAYFSTQKAVVGHAGDASLTEIGKRIYSGGISYASVPACASCHGPGGGGVTPAYPRLAGQHGQYIIAQLKAFKSKDRANDDSQVMRDIAGRMDEHQIEAVAEYLGGL